MSLPTPPGGCAPAPARHRDVVRLRPAVRVPKRTISCAPPDRSPSKE
uniref:Uncharacterized protein n=1 Tax=Siphoviridae sp. ctXOZ1 TaxID=2823585 RepID=A0A8S5LBE6_9CAUD|nr:MAG TPA: hypothetical protein [Siphoviridae sp. ctXOZ1]